MIFLYILLGLLGLFLIFLLVIFFIVRKEHRNLFFHRCEPNNNIKSYTLDDFNLETEAYNVDADGKTIRGYFYKNKILYPNKLVVFCHGMFSCKNDYIQDIAYIANKGFLVYGFDYLGTHESDGMLSGFGNSIYSTDMVLKKLEDDAKFKDFDIYLIGHSWGGFAVTNVIKFHPNIKGVVGLAPMTSIVEQLHFGSKIPRFIGKIFLLYDKHYCGSYSSMHSEESLKDYKGDILIIQSVDDNMVPYKSSLGLIKNALGERDNVSYIINEGRKHNPYYTLDSAIKLNQFYKEIKEALTPEEKLEVYNHTDFKACGVIDSEVFDKAIDLFSK